MCIRDRVNEEETITSPQVSQQTTNVQPPNMNPPVSADQLDQKFIDVLMKAIEQNNKEGMDYLEFKNSLQSLSKLAMDEATRFKSAFIMGKMCIRDRFVTNHAGLYCHQLVDEGNYFIEVIEKPNFKITQRGFHNQQVCNDFNENGKTDTINYISASPLQFRNGGLTYHPTTSVQGFVWKDENENNIFEPGTDTNMDNIVVLLFSSQNVFIKSTPVSYTHLFRY